MSKYILGTTILFIVGIGAWTVAPKEKIVYRDKPTNHSSGWCKLPLPVGTKGTPVKGDLNGLQGVIAGKIDNGVDCAYYVKFKNKDIWNGSGINYSPVNAENFVKVAL